MIKKKWFFAIYVVIILALLVSFLIFFPKNNNENPEIPKNEISEETSKDQEINDKPSNENPGTIDPDVNNGGTTDPETPNEGTAPENPGNNNPENPGNNEPNNPPEDDLGDDNTNKGNEPTMPENPPVEPNEPTEPNIPSEPENPTEPEDPSDPTNPDKPNTPTEPETPDSPDQPTEDPETPEDETIYAESITLLCPREITMVNNGKVVLNSGYLRILPKEIVDFEIEIEPKSEEDINGLVFNNNVITAYKTGVYTITFSVKKSATKYLKDYLTVKVVSEFEDDKILQIKNTLLLNNPEPIENVFTIDNIYTVSILNNDELKLITNILTPLELGEFDVAFALSKDYVSYIYNFPFIIKEEPRITIELYYEDAIINSGQNIQLSIGETFAFFYEVKDKNFEIAEQEIDIKIIGDGVLKVLSSASPMIILKCLGYGSVTFEITVVGNNEVFEYNLIIS